MALDFPDNPTDGEVYIASNGIEYTYNASADSWTGALGTGSSYWSQTDDGSGSIYVTNTNARVGVGTDSPTNKLDVVSSGINTVASVRNLGDDTKARKAIIDFDFGTDTGARIQCQRNKEETTADSFFLFYVGGAESANAAMKLAPISTGTGVTIGATGTPNATLDVRGDAIVTGTTTSNDDVEITNSDKGVILSSPIGNRYRVTVDDSGNLTTTLL